MSGSRKAQMSEVANRFVEQVLRVGVDGMGPVKGAVEVAEEHLQVAQGDSDAAVDRLIATHVRLAAVSGFVTGAGGLVTLPVSLPASLTGMYILGARLAAAIAHLRGHNVHSEEVRSAILVCLLGTGAAGAINAAGIEIGQKSAVAALRKVPGRVLIDLNKRVGFRLVTKAGTKGAINLMKLAPLAGAPIGATVDGLSCRAIGKYAKHAFAGGELA